MTNVPYPIEELLRLVKASGESSNIDAKAPMAFEEGENAAGLAKDIAAFANSRDGGAIVIGKRQNDGQFEYVGVAAEQAATFDTTRVANWVNSRFNPPVVLTCHTVEDEGKLFVVIVVAEFADIPVLCVRDFQAATGKGKLLLKERTIYVRTANAESAPLGSTDQLRELIGLATRKRSDEMLSTFHAMLQGRPLVPPPDDHDQFARQLVQVQTAVEDPMPDKMVHGSWSMSFHPSVFQAERFSEPEQLEQIISQHAVRLRDEYPAYQKGTAPFNWGIGNAYYGESWGFSKAGLFLWCEAFDENTYCFRSPWQRISEEPDPEVPARQWINYLPHLFKLIEFFTFMARMAPIYDSSESLTYRLVAGSLRDRKLLSTDPEISLEPRFAEPARESLFRFSRTSPIQEFSVSWKDQCAIAAKRFFELFPGHRIEGATLRRWVDRFQVRDFGR